MLLFLLGGGAARAAPDVEPSRLEATQQALIDHFQNLRSLRYDFTILGGQNLEFLSISGSWVYRQGHARLRYEVEHRDGGRGHLRGAEGAGTFRFWSGSEARAGGLGRVSTKPHPEVLGAYLPFYFGQKVFSHPQGWLPDFLSVAEARPCFDESESNQACVQLRVAAETETLRPEARLWLAPKHGGAIVRAEILMPREMVPLLAENAFQEGEAPRVEDLAEGDLFVYLRWTVDSFQAFPGDLHVPIAGTLSYPWNPSVGGYRLRVDAGSLEVNAEVSDADLALGWPLGATIVDETREQVGTNGLPARYEAVSEHYLLNSLEPLGDLVSRQPVPELAAATAAADQHVRESACGASSLFLVLAAHRKRTALETLFRFAYRDHEHPGSFLALADLARRHGLEPTGLKATWEALGALPTPFIAHFEFEEEGSHFVIVWEVDGDRILGSDPPAPPEWSDRETFEAVWTGHILVLETQSASDDAT